MEREKHFLLFASSAADN